MEIDMKNSKFQFDEPFVNKMFFEENERFDKSSVEEIKTNIMCSVLDKTENSAYVNVQVNIGDDENAPFKLCVSMCARFYWDNSDDKSEVDHFLNYNAVALLISYIRPVIANVTMNSRFPVFNLPFIDLTVNDSRKITDK